MDRSEGAWLGQIDAAGPDVGVGTLDHLIDCPDIQKLVALFSLVAADSSHEYLMVGSMPRACLAAMVGSGNLFSGRLYGNVSSEGFPVHDWRSSISNKFWSKVSLRNRYGDGSSASPQSKSSATGEAASVPTVSFQISVTKSLARIDSIHTIRVALLAHKSGISTRSNLLATLIFKMTKYNDIILEIDGQIGTIKVLCYHLHRGLSLTYLLAQPSEEPKCLWWQASGGSDMRN